MELWDKKVLLWLNHMYPNLSISIIAIHWIVYWIHLRQHVYLAALWLEWFRSFLRGGMEANGSSTQSEVDVARTPQMGMFVLERMPPKIIGRSWSCDYNWCNMMQQGSRYQDLGCHGSRRGRSPEGCRGAVHVTWWWNLPSRTTGGGDDRNSWGAGDVVCFSFSVLYWRFIYIFILLGQLLF